MDIPYQNTNLFRYISFNVVYDSVIPMNRTKKKIKETSYFAIDPLQIKTQWMMTKPPYKERIDKNTRRDGEKEL